MEKKEQLSNYTISRELARDMVLSKCGQMEPLPFSECYPDSILSKCRKTGSGSFGEVYLFPNDDGGETVLKVMPIQGRDNIKGLRQKKFHEVLSELVTAMELSNLRFNTKNNTTSFNQVMQVRCVKGCYPDRLIKLFDRNPYLCMYRKNLSPIYSNEQLYIVLELANGGTDVGTFMFQNAAQVYSVFKQITCALAIAESELKFEHRDLHFGNILITPVKKNKKLKFLLNGKTISIPTNGVEVSIIDFTFSRIMFEDTVLFHDLSKYPGVLFARNCIYRLMMGKNGNNWRDFEPYTNLQWLHYLLEQFLKRARPRLSARTQDRYYYERLERMSYEILQYRSAQHFVKENFMSDNCPRLMCCCIL